MRFCLCVLLNTKFVFESHKKKTHIKFRKKAYLELKKVTHSLNSLRAGVESKEMALIRKYKMRLLSISEFKCCSKTEFVLT